jgi:hypothetical protein
MGSGLFGRLEQEIDAREKTPGLSMADIISLPDGLRRLVNWMVRERQVEAESAAAFIGEDVDSVRALLADMIEQGYVTEFEMRGETYYRVRLAARRGRDIPLDIWDCLDDKCEL